VLSYINVFSLFIVFLTPSRLAAVRIVLWAANELHVSASKSPLLSARAACRKLHSVDVQHLKPLPTTSSVARVGRAVQPARAAESRGRKTECFK